MPNCPKCDSGNTSFHPNPKLELMICWNCGEEFPFEEPEPNDCSTCIGVQQFAQNICDNATDPLTYQRAVELIAEGTWELPKTYEIQCSACGTSVALPYTNNELTNVDITPLNGWSSPPLTCPSCSPPNCPNCAEKGRTNRKMNTRGNNWWCVWCEHELPQESPPQAEPGSPQAICCSCGKAFPDPNPGGTKDVTCPKCDEEFRKRFF